ncbi:MBL fold metallo-hydrolase [Robiginitomaculum antarcticum]|uniref:MBL fold metallo-hydrolase n=1 Tax=Robiginitomaculum antarcticum TaxID=437507 RepID=UPI000373386E|nr:MBL fold metallo-hydrolase [Robiginitomaculum antarcticum]
MFIDKIKSEGLAHLSYLIGDGSQACVIDPRRDCEIYIEAARKKGATITHIIETHRNEDLISGAPILAQMTGAKVFHGPNADGIVKYAQTTKEGDKFTFGAMRLEILETPGHTFDSISIVIFDENHSKGAVGVFTGDALFVGDTGRTDFYPDKAEKVAGLLFDSLKKLKALGDQAIIYPAHGAGSVCGNNMANREFSTIGHEVENNPMLGISSREKFIKKKLSEKHYIPQYFSLMEKLNLVGGAAIKSILMPPPVSPQAFKSKDADRVIDIRSVTSFAGAHIPESLAIPVDMLSAFAGYFLRDSETIYFVCDGPQQAELAARHLARMGFDKIIGRLDGVVGFSTTGADIGDLPFVDAKTVKHRLTSTKEDWTLLDVRSQDEFDNGHIDGAIHHYVGHIENGLGDLDPDKSYTVMCGSGARATIAASIMKANNFKNVDVFLGSMGAWQATMQK